MTIRSKLLLVAIFGVLGGFLFIKLTQADFKRIADKLNKEYRFIAVTDSISGSVQGIHTPSKVRRSPFFVRLDFQEGFKYTLDTKGYALSHPDIAIGDVCKAGAALTKKANSDTVRVTYEDEVYSFLLIHHD